MNQCFIISTYLIIANFVAYNNSNYTTYVIEA